jgi:hypothetical protein
MTPVEFYHAIAITNKKEEARFKTQYEVARWMMKHQWNMAGKKLKKQLKKVEDVERFMWDSEKKKNQTPEEMKQELISIFNSCKRKKK